MAQTQEEKEQGAREFEDLREIEAAFKLNVGNNLDKMLAIVTGQYRCPTLPGEPDKITRSIKDNDEFRARMRMMGRREGDYEGGEYEHGQVRRAHKGYEERESFRPQYREVGGGGGLGGGYEYSPPPGTNKYAGIFNELERYRFADDDARRERQMSHLVNKIRAALQELTLRDVAYNTRKAFKEHVASVEPAAGGLTVKFDFSGTKVNVTARGAFNGDETVCVYQKDGKVHGGVVRVEEDGSKTDLTSNYGITLSK
jgi:hypothetical protein